MELSRPLMVASLADSEAVDYQNFIIFWKFENQSPSEQASMVKTNNLAI